MEVANAGGVQALVMLARNCNYEGVQEQVSSIFSTLSKFFATDFVSVLFFNRLLVL